MTLTDLERWKTVNVRLMSVAMIILFTNGVDRTNPIQRCQIGSDRYTARGCLYSHAPALPLWSAVAWVNKRMYRWKQESVGGKDVDRASLIVTCEGAGYSEIPRDLPSSAVTLDLSDNSLESLGPLSRLRHVVNLRLRGNSINRISDNSPTSLGNYVLRFATFCYSAVVLLAMQSAVIASANSSVRLSVRPSVTRWYCTQTNEDRIMRSSLWDSKNTLVFFAVNRSWLI